MSEEQKIEASRRPYFQAYRVTTWDGTLVDEPIASSFEMAKIIAFDNYGHEMDGVSSTNDLYVELIGEEE